MVNDYISRSRFHRGERSALSNLSQPFHEGEHGERLHLLQPLCCVEADG